MTNRTRVWLTAATLTVVSLVAAGCSSASPAATEVQADASAAPYYDMLPDSIKDAGKISIGSDISYPPYEYYGDDGELAGFEPLLFDLVQEQLGVELDWQNGAFATLFAGLDAGRFDVEIGATNDTAERQEKYDVVDYVTNSSGILVAEGNPEKVTDDPMSLCGLTIGGAEGTSQLDRMKAQSDACVAAGEEPLDVLVLGADPATVYNAVKTGQADGAVDNYASVVAAADASEGALEASPLQVGKTYLGVFVPKGNQELTDAFMAALGDVVGSPEYLSILEDVGLEATALDTPVLNGATTAPLE